MIIDLINLINLRIYIYNLEKSNNVKFNRPMDNTNGIATSFGISTLERKIASDLKYIEIIS
jgi:hypothetical protein